MASQTSNYEPISSNVYFANIRNQKALAIDACSCCSKTGEWICFNDACLDFQIHTECTRCDPDCCRNMRFQKQEYADLSVKDTPSKGKGLFVNEDVVKDQFLIEYVGEVIREQERAKREARGEESYVMSLKGGLFVDAFKKGNISRFINHSCEPNCFAQVWIVEGIKRAGIFALRPITVGTELTMDYGWMSPTPSIRCYCGSDSCNGYVERQDNNKGMVKTMNMDKQSPKRSRDEAMMSNDKILAGVLRDIVRISRLCRELQTQLFKVCKELDGANREIDKIKRDVLDQYYNLCVDSVRKCRGTYDEEVAEEGCEKVLAIFVKRDEDVQRRKRMIDELKEKKDRLEFEIDGHKGELGQRVNQLTSMFAEKK